ncbi:MAG: DUF4405 domain-containing protein [Nibricoccus sp.]
MRIPASAKPSLSPFVAVAFLVISLTGALLFFHIKNGVVMVLHEWFGWAFIVAGLVHILLNLKPLLSYSKFRSGWVSLWLALMLTVALAIVGLNHHGNPHREGNNSPVTSNRP